MLIFTSGHAQRGTRTNEVMHKRTHKHIHIYMEMIIFTQADTRRGGHAQMRSCKRGHTHTYMEMLVFTQADTHRGGHAQLRKCIRGHTNTHMGILTRCSHNSTSPQEDTCKRTHTMDHTHAHKDACGTALLCLSFRLHALFLTLPLQQHIRKDESTQ